jgi:MerR family transcriptional regulator, heat shock protein HspR
MTRGARGGSGRETPLYMISVAAELAGVHPQTLRIYERKRLLAPKRSAGNTRLYSDSDIERLRLIQQLTSEGINLAGVQRILALRADVESLVHEVERLRAKAADSERRARDSAARAPAGYKAEIVLVKRGGLAQTAAHPLRPRTGGSGR